MAGNPQASNTAELLLAALSACMIKGMESISHEIIVDTDEPDRRLDLLHENVKKYGTVFNTISPGTELTGVLHRKVEPS